MVPTAAGQQPADEPLLSDDARSALVRMLHATFPHDSFPDGPYQRTADAIIDAAKTSTWSRLALLHGLDSLGAASGGAFADLDDADALKVLRHVEGTEFFGFVRRTAVVALYDDPEVWSALGYEGASFDKGGYIERGFDDLDWLPDPRVEEYSGSEQFVEIDSGLPAAGTATIPAQKTGGMAPEASHPGVAQQQAQDVATAEAL
jgi:hypothetical protein